MIMWHIEVEGEEWEIEVGPVTILKNHHNFWFKLVRLIDDFFTNKSSEVQVYEDTQPLHKKDWECLFLPFDAHLQLDKVTAKSPLKSVLDEVCEELSLSPAFHELLEVWDELKEELQFVNRNLEKYNLSVNISSFEQDDLKSYLSFQSLHSMMTPIEYKKLLLRLFTDKVIEKKRLVIIELPELYANKDDFIELMSLINDLALKGIRFIIVTGERIEGNSNFVFQEKIINEACIEMRKRRILSELPFVCDDEIFEEAKRILLQAVDNSFIFEEKELLLTNNDEAIVVILFVLIQQLNIAISLDTSGLPMNLNQFIKAYS